MAAAAIEPTWTTDFFRPTNRYRDLIRARHGDDSFELPNFHTEVELIPDMSPEHILAAGITWGGPFSFPSQQVRLDGTRRICLSWL
jgi:hypothetical protein